MGSSIIIKQSYFDNIRVAVDSMNKFFQSDFKTKAFPVINHDFELEPILRNTIFWLNHIEPSWVNDPDKVQEILSKLRVEVTGVDQTQPPVENTNADMQQQPVEAPIEEPSDGVTTEADESMDAVAAEDPTPETTQPPVDNTPVENVDPTQQNLTEIEPQLSDNPWMKIITGEKGEVAMNHYYAFVGFKFLKYITDNFEQFEGLLDGIYSFELFTKPSQFRSQIETFSNPVDMNELESIAPLPGEYRLFSAEMYVPYIFNSKEITLPDNMNIDTEMNRFKSFMDLQNIEIIIDDKVQEAAEVDYFKDTKPDHIQYNSKTKKFKVSKQLEAAINKLIAGLKKCESTDDLRTFFETKQPVEMFASNVIPSILMKVFDNQKKYPSGFTSSDAENYIKSYNSIDKQNPGAKRFARIDLFSTFKTDKEATIDFIEKFMKLDLINNQSASIMNQKLKTVFNIFDSHIYFTILHNLMDDDSSVEDFIKSNRKRINDNSKKANPYTQKDESIDNTIKTSKDLDDESSKILKEYTDLTISDTMYCEEFIQAVYDEIDSLTDTMYNRNVSQIMLNHYVGESYQLFPELTKLFQEELHVQSYETPSERGDIPEYMRNRINISDDQQKKEPTITDVKIEDKDMPDDVPLNDIDDLANSIRSRMDSDSTDLGDMFGADANLPMMKGKPNAGTVVYNITNNNYSNSHNVTTADDHSTGKHTTNLRNSTQTNSNDLSSNKRTYAARKPLSNNYDNTNASANTKESNTFSNGKSIQEVFALLDSKEPLFVEAAGNNSGDVLTTTMPKEQQTPPSSVNPNGATPPKSNSTTKAMDVDRKSLPLIQGMKKKVQGAVNTVKGWTKPIGRVELWMRHMIDTLTKRDENAIKSDILNNKSYRSSLYKVARIALKGGKLAIFSMISPWLGLIYAGKIAMDLNDRQRLRREIASEVSVELQIMDDKIKAIDESAGYGQQLSPEKQKEKYQLMRMKQKLMDMAADSQIQHVVNPKSTY